MLAIKRIYEPCDVADGYRVLVDRLWPRGLAREKAKIEAWAKTLAPSNDLRLWYAHRPERWEEFRLRYRQELAAPEATQELARLRDIARTRRITLLTATRSEVGSHASVLAALLVTEE